jgi:hypothetical protein
MSSPRSREAAKEQPATDLSALHQRLSQNPAYREAYNNDTTGRSCATCCCMYNTEGRCTVDRPACPDKTSSVLGALGVLAVKPAASSDNA